VVPSSAPLSVGGQSALPQVGAKSYEIGAHLDYVARLLQVCAVILRLCVLSHVTKKYLPSDTVEELECLLAPL
jgi:hypothetical protein